MLCVGISTELDLAISGAKDGTCLLHTVRGGQYIHTLQPRKGLKCEIHHVAVSSIGRIVVYSEDVTHRQKVWGRCALQNTLTLPPSPPSILPSYPLSSLPLPQLSTAVPPCLHLYTVNGVILLEKELTDCINAMVVIDKYLITGNTKGYLTFRNLYK